ncbi:MAG: tRNA (adenosine(37)-N6)-threonylcarbamoyltransferase complex dimerization subunit type 1 TsaB [Cytophagales bacterium]|nr:tRNA (adenosine(37)-N6)-threonylcarbamoyltransferase complex dimerization subunit type 1 TsaB [Cytophagales bacterium]MDW8384488.1 tRNA (adenosine(37)-N6)-threonylcarbamoyltransferase complex dimerization subunit type 1 TsaB [Flammeovirgaceae bacterium]
MILSIETATRQQCSVALHDTSGTLKFERIFLQPDQHLEALSQGLEEIFSLPSDLRKIQAVAVSAGPGSYTGLRIGVSMAKALAYSLQCPLIAVNTLFALAQEEFFLESHKNKKLICPMIDARRNEVYTMIVDSQGNEILPMQTHILTKDSFSSLLDSNTMIFIGNGAEKAQRILYAPTAIFKPFVYPLARQVGRRAVQLFHEKKFVDVAYFEPYYLKDFIGKKLQNT